MRFGACPPLAFIVGNDADRVDPQPLDPSHDGMAGFVVRGCFKRLGPSHGFLQGCARLGLAVDLLEGSELADLADGKQADIR